MRDCGFVKAYAYYGITLPNHRNNWSGVNYVLNIVALTIWHHGLRGGRYHYVPAVGERRHGHAKMIKDLIFARDYCGGIFHVVIGVQRPNGKNEYFARALRMRIVSLNTETGEFEAEMVKQNELAEANPVKLPIAA